MADFLRDLLIAEDHASPYVWAAVALAHAMIGVALMIFASILAAALFGDAAAGLIVVASGYAIWELVQIVRGGGVLDSGLDWLFVVLGAVAVSCVWHRRAAGAAVAIGALFMSVWAGVARRVRRRR